MLPQQAYGTSAPTTYAGLGTRHPSLYQSTTHLNRLGAPCDDGKGSSAIRPSFRVSSSDGAKGWWVQFFCLGSEKGTTS
jgi:hypothetical protein